MKRINLDQMKNMSVDNLIELYRDGYRLEEHTPITSLSDFHTFNFSNIHTLQEPLLDPVTNFGKAIVSSCTGGCTATATEVTVDDGTKFPDPTTRAFNLIWWNSTDYADPSDDPNKEIVRCTAKSGNVLTITRSQEGTSASTKNSGGKVYKMILSVTKKTISDISSTITDRVAKSGDTMTGDLIFSGTQKIIGGTGTTSDLTLQTTNGVGITGADMHFLVGSNGATEAMTILNSGNVGIGTTNPQSLLHVNGTGITIGSFPGAYPLAIFTAGAGAAGTMLYIHNPTTDRNAHVSFYAVDSGAVLRGSGLGFDPTNNGMYFGDSGVARLFVKSTGNVGIGTTTPSTPLHVVGDETITGNILMSATKGIDGGLRVKVGVFSRDMTAASGTQVITGVGFKPSAIFVIAIGNDTANKGASWGISSGDGGFCISDYNTVTADAWNEAGLIYLIQSNIPDRQTAVLTSFDSDGFTLTWTKTTSPTGTARIGYIAFR